MNHISYSELKEWVHCAFSHKLIRLDKIDGFKGNAFTAFGNASGEGVSINVNFFNMTTTTKPASLSGTINSFSTSALHNANVFAGAMLPSQVSTVLNGIRFSADSGNISSGRVKVYGIN